MSSAAAIDSSVLPLHVHTAKRIFAVESDWRKGITLSPMAQTDEALSDRPGDLQRRAFPEIPDDPRMSSPCRAAAQVFVSATLIVATTLLDFIDDVCKDDLPRTLPCAYGTPNWI